MEKKRSLSVPALLLSLITALGLAFAGCADGNDWTMPPSNTEKLEIYGPLHLALWSGNNPDTSQGRIHSGVQSFLNEIDIHPTDQRLQIGQKLPDNPAHTARFHQFLRNDFLSDAITNNLRMGPEFIKGHLIPERIQNVHVAICRPYNFGGWASAHHNEFFVNFDDRYFIDPELNTWTVIHELGHMLGFGETVTEFINWWTTGSSQFEGVFRFEHAPDAFIAFYMRAHDVGRTREFWDGLTNKRIMRQLWDSISPRAAGSNLPVVSLLDLQYSKAALNSARTDNQADTTIRDSYEWMLTGLVSLFADPNNEPLATNVAHNASFLRDQAQSRDLPARQLVFTQFITPATPENVQRARDQAAGRAATITPAAFSASHIGITEKKLEALGLQQNHVTLEDLMGR